MQIPFRLHVGTSCVRQLITMYNFKEQLELNGKTIYGMAIEEGEA